MNDWTEGYVTEVDYTYGFYKEMSPASIGYALSAAGFESPPIDRYTYCELGFGQGAGLNLLAAANPQAEFYGTDFNPAHSAGAARMAKASGLTNLHVYDDSFEQFAARDLPKFDYITLHGVWSWVGADNCKHIVDFIGRHLKVGGAVYISYNTLPGWTHALPMRGLLSQYVEYQTAPADSLSSRIDGALKLLNALGEVPGSYFKQTPQLAERIKGLQGQNRNYLAHEYLNRHWTPVFFSQMVAALEAAKLTFAAHANPLGCIDSLNHTKELQAILDGIPSPIFREMVRDLGINQGFRRDIFVRGPRRLSRHDHAAALLDTVYALVAERSQCALKIKTTVSEVTLQAATYDPLLDALASGPKSGRELAQILSASVPGAEGRVLQAVVVLVGAGYIAPCVSPELEAAARESSARFNRHVIARTVRGTEGDFTFLACPRIASGLALNRMAQLFLHAESLGNLTAEQRAQALWTALKSTRQALIRDGKAIEGDEASVAELVQRHQEWSAGPRKLLLSLDLL